MKDLIHYLLFSNAGSNLNNIALLTYRVLLALELFRVHGLKKFRGDNGKPEHVPNPLGLPDKLNSTIATFSDTVVPFLLMLGVGTRLVVLPTIGVTAIGYFVVHRRDSAEVRDVPYIYTISLLLMLVLGAGTYSIDHLLLPYF